MHKQMLLLDTEKDKDLDIDEGWVKNIDFKLWNDIDSEMPKIKLIWCFQLMNEQLCSMPPIQKENKKT